MHRTSNMTVQKERERAFIYGYIILFQSSPYFSHQLYILWSTEYILRPYSISTRGCSHVNRLTPAEYLLTDYRVHTKYRVQEHSYVQSNTECNE